MLENKINFKKLNLNLFFFQFNFRVFSKIFLRKFNRIYFLTGNLSEIHILHNFRFGLFSFFLKIHFPPNFTLFKTWNSPEYETHLCLYLKRLLTFSSFFLSTVSLNLFANQFQFSLFWAVFEWSRNSCFAASPRMCFFYVFLCFSSFNTIRTR